MSKRRPRFRWGRTNGFLLLALLWVGCAGTRNYDDPYGPIFSDSIASDSVASDSIDSVSVVFGSAAIRAEETSSRTDCRVVTFNLEHAREIEGAGRFFQAHEDLKDVDLLLLQEMDEPGVRRLAETLGMNWVYAPASVARKTDRDFGNAILSRYPILSFRKIQLPHAARVGGARRIAVAATVEMSGRRVRVYSVHLALPLMVSSTGRREQLETVLADARAHPGPVLIGGDFNSGSIGLLLEEAGFSWPTRGLGATTKIFGVDHIFLRGFDLASVPPSGVVRDHPGLSDHHPVWVLSKLADPRRRALAPWDWARRDRTSNIDGFAHMEPTLARGAKPGRRGLLELKERGFRTILDLSGGAGRGAAEELGFEYRSIPLTAFLWSSPPKPDQTEEFLRLLGDESLRPLYFHCVKGKDRTGMMAAIYRIEEDRWTNGEAILEMQEFGYHDYFDDLIQYVRQYVPRRTIEP